MDVSHLAAALPVSALQEEMWLLEHLEGVQPLVRSALKISGRVDVRRLAGAVEAVSARHELLRCGFRSVAGKLQRFEAQAARVRVLHFIDLRGVADGGARDCVDFMQPRLQELHLPLEEPPLMQLCLMRIAAETWVLYTAIHHIICDEHSNNILCNEILTAYAGGAFSRPAGRFTDFLRLPQPPGGNASHREFWRKVVGECDVAPVPREMNGRCRTPGPSRGTSSSSSAVDEARVQQLCRALRCTPAVLFLGALQIWLARSSGGKSPPVCMPMQLRDDLEESPLVGFLTNLVVIPTQLCDADTALAFFQKLRQRFYDTWSHRCTPFGEIGSFYTGQRRASVHPLSEYMFVLETAPEVLRDVAGCGLKIEILPTRAVIPGSAFAFIVTRTAQQTLLRVQYDANAVTSAWAESALVHIPCILGELSAVPDLRIGRIGLQSAAGQSPPLPVVGHADSQVERLPELRGVCDRGLTTEESAVLSVWCAVLGTPVEDVDLNFFDAGGRSMHLMRLCLELRTTGLVLRLNEIFEYPTVRAQAGLLQLQRRGGKTERATPFELAARRGEMVRDRLADTSAARRN